MERNNSLFYLIDPPLTSEQVNQELLKQRESFKKFMDSLDSYRLEKESQSINEFCNKFGSVISLFFDGILYIDFSKLNDIIKTEKDSYRTKPFKRTKLGKNWYGMYDMLFSYMFKKDNQKFIKYFTRKYDYNLLKSLGNGK